MRDAAGRVGRTLLVLACIAYQAFVHWQFRSTSSGPLHLVLMCLPFAAIACWIVVRSRHRLPWLAALSVAAAAVVLLEHQEKLGLAAVSGIPHSAAYLFLLGYFGRTLRRGREPIVTRFARRVHGTLPPGMELYTRRLTMAWCVFFGAQLIVSAMLLAFASLETWSLFVNVLNLPLLGLMFVGQWAYGVVRHPDYPAASVGRAIEAFTRDASLSGGTEAR